MTDDILLVTFTATNHILGAFTRSGGPPDPKAIKPQDVVGQGGLVLRLPGAPTLSITVDPSQLSLTTVPANDGLLLRPSSWGLTGTPPQPQALSDTETEPTVALDGVNATVTVVTVSNVNRDLYLLVGTAVIPMTLQANTKTISAAAQAPSGPNAFLLLFPGYQAVLGQAAVP